jgi:putative endonuclease
VAVRRGLLAFIEVKASSGDRHGPPELRVDRKKQKRIIEAAAEYLSRLKYEPEEIRFDVIAVTWRKNSKPRINHLESAFRVEED